jgi:hypothetical protein
LTTGQIFGGPGGTAASKFWPLVKDLTGDRIVCRRICDRDNLRCSLQPLFENRLVKPIGSAVNQQSNAEGGAQNLLPEAMEAYESSQSTSHPPIIPTARRGALTSIYPSAVHAAQSTGIRLPQEPHGTALASLNSAAKPSLSLDACAGSPAAAIAASGDGDNDCRRGAAVGSDRCVAGPGVNRFITV